ncbi:MAG: SdpI family protein [Anaerolineales bacterium]
MSTRLTIVLSIILIAIAVVSSAMVYDRLPERVASHWNAANQVDGYISRFWGVSLMPLISAGMLALLLVIPHIDPLQANVEKFRPAFNGFITLMIAFLLYVHGLTLAWNLGYDRFDMGAALLPALGLLFIFVGFMMRQAKRNYFIGIRTPWTLSSDRVWDKTHRVGGMLFIASGLLALLGAFFPLYAPWLLLTPLLGSTFFLVVYSYLLYQQEMQA